MKTLLIAVTAAAALASSASGEARNLQNFDGVSADGRFRVEVTQGEGYAVELTGRDVSHVNSRIEGSTLRLEQTDHPLFGDLPRLDVVAHVTMPRVASLGVARGLVMQAENLRSDDLHLAVAMGGELTTSGACSDLRVNVSMGGDLNARNLDCANADVNVSMGGDVSIRAHSAVTAQASMGGDIRVSGKPAQRTFHSSMGGDISYE